jgi:hypothetical protein
MQLLELEVDPILMRQRAALEYERLVVESSHTKVDLAAAEANLAKAKLDLDRNEKLFHQEVISADLFEIYATTHQVLENQARELRGIVRHTDKALERLKYMAETFVPGGENDPVRQALRLEEEKMRVFQDKVAPIQLMSPIDGVVTFIHRRAHENVLAGEAVITITASGGDRIVGYLPMHFPIAPKVGMEVEVQTRTLPRGIGRGRILGFGPQFEITTNLFNRIIVPPLGRPVSVSIPPAMTLSPGEPVDLRLLNPMN